jgi:N-acyl-D-aspartate/D-glutamate deacylase
MPAERMGIKNRGKIAVGMAADLLLFDPDEFTDNADYSSSIALATGMETVILNGQVVYSEKTFYNKNGRVVSRPKE